MEGVSVVIPCLNEEQYIKDCIEGLIENGFDNSLLEILVVDGGSSDNTLLIVNEIAEQYKFVKVVHNAQKKTPFALNLGIQHAIYDYVLIAGAHANYPKAYISRLYSLIQRSNIDVVGGSLETKTKHTNSKTKAICFVLSHPLGVGNSTFRIGADELQMVDTVPFGLYRKEIFENIGLYNERLIRNHDMELSTRIRQAGYQIWMDPTYSCTYYARETYMGLAMNNYGNGFWNLKTLAITKRFNALGLRHYIPMLFVLSILFPLLLAAFSIKHFAFLSLGIMLSHAFILFIVSFFGDKKNSFRIFYAFIVLHYSYGIGSLAGFLSWLKFKKKAVRN